jgi:hypothetical protein
MIRPKHRARARSRRVFLEPQRLEARELLAATPLLWSSGVSLPAPRGGPAAVDLAGTLIVVGGKSTGSVREVDRLAPGSSAWSALPGVNIGRVGPGLVSTPNGLLVFGGSGSNGTSALDSAVLFNVAGANTDDAATMLSTRKQLAFANDGSSQAYAIGGVSDDGVNLATVERFNSATNTWTLVASLPAARSGAAAAYDGTGSIYVVGGSSTVNGTDGTSTLYRYTVSSDTWTSLAALPINVRDAAAVFAPDGTLEVLGGISNGATVATVESYDPATDAWTTNTPLPAPLSSAAAVIDSLGRVVLIGGFDASTQPLATVEVSQVVTQATAAPLFTSAPTPAALKLSTGSTFHYTAAATGNPLPNFALVSGPAGMTVDPFTGLVAWNSPAPFLGSVPVTIKASNVLGSVNESFTINVVDGTPPSPPGTPVITALGKTSVSLSWAPSTDNVGVTGYTVTWIYTTGHSGRGGGYTTHYVTLATTTGAGATTANISGLVQGKTYFLYASAHDAAGNKSAYSGRVVVTPGALPSGFTATQVGNPTFSPITVVANHTLSVQLSASSFSPPTYSVLKPPAGMTINATTGLVTWKPTAANVGTTSVTFQATNPFGTATLVVPIGVTADVPIPGFTFDNLNSPTFSVIGLPTGLRITDGSNTPSTYSVVSAPANVSIDPHTGAVHWVPTPSQAGAQAVTFRLTNSAGTAVLTVNPVIYIADAPQNVSVTGANTKTPTLHWKPPVHNKLVASYRVMISGPNFSTYSFTTSAGTLSAALSGLAYSPATYQVNIQALDAHGNQGLWNTSLAFTYTSGV